VTVELKKQDIKRVCLPKMWIYLERGEGGKGGKRRNTAKIGKTC